ncbi:Poly (ADP-ribose) polymerase [Desmophyllum pertusum]|uniref:Poly [ADP-ribose] polymerase n=1 Tax=Desmophyllum pertusum TaxID=174260 RepID=A0A9W9Z9S0_9CNID|nr:Poly (ADP-ribose) polymerase [Desmophyllum pertusum]
MLNETTSLPIKLGPPMPSQPQTAMTSLYTWFKLPRKSSEYQDVATKFQHTVGSVAIVNIERIQNPHLYQVYQLRKEKMDKDNGGNNERQLFHGTNPDSVT